jgi:hypothetical protein
MLRRVVYTVTPGGQADVPDIDLPLKVELLADCVWATLEQGGGGMRMIVDRRVDRNALEKFREQPDGAREELPGLRIRDDDNREHVLAADLLSGISFLTDVPLMLSRLRPLEDRFVAEDEGDHEALAAFGTEDVYRETGGTIVSRTFGGVEVTAERLADLLAQRAGLRIYADALKLGTDVARFRELWRALESAFNEQDNKLIALLAEYQPAQEMSFTRKELRHLKILRDKASHAASKAGVKQLIAVERDCSQEVTRLKNLVERVILTKRSWGKPTKHVDVTLPLSGYVGPAKSHSE